MVRDGAADDLDLSLDQIIAGRNRQRYGGPRRRSAARGVGRRARSRTRMAPRKRAERSRSRRSRTSKYQVGQSVEALWQPSNDPDRWERAQINSVEPDGYTILFNASQGDTCFRHERSVRGRGRGGAAKPKPKRKSIRTTGKVRVGSLGAQVTSDDVKEIFEKIGIVTKAYISYKKNGESSGVAIVEYAKKSDALAAAQQFNLLKVDGKAMTVHVEDNDAADSDASDDEYDEPVKRRGRGSRRAGVSGKTPQDYKPRERVRYTDNARQPYRARNGGQTYVDPVNPLDRENNWTPETYSGRGRGRGAGRAPPRFNQFGDGARRSGGRGRGRSSGGGRGGGSFGDSYKSVGDLDKELDNYKKMDIE